MSVLTFIDKSNVSVSVPKQYLKGKRRLTPAEISVLVDNLNSSEDPQWRNVYVDDDQFGFDPTLIKNSMFSGFIVLGRIWPATLKYHDLELNTGIYDSRLKNIVAGNDNAIHNTSIENYHIGSRIMLLNIQEMSCTNHSKFGNGILKEEEPESNRIDIAICNENGRRAVLPFENMIPADAYIWARYRDDKLLMERLKELTEAEYSKSLDTFGIVEDDAVIKNTTLIKDVKIGSCAYIKGAFKIKNVTILSSPDEVTQIGEGVELVNGIAGYGCHIFYQAVAVRFVIGRNCQLKYGARLLNSILGDNSTVSCCELLNNLIFPFHEQHHNSSFLIATTVLGQSNIAAGATIGSNHNSRSPDGEIIAGRGFWPGLCSSFKHNSRFASFVLAAKGSYSYELDIPYPFSLVTPGETQDSAVHITPAWWFLYNMFAIVRNQYKFKARDRRVKKIQHIETNPLAPDTMQEVKSAISRIIDLTAENLETIAPQSAQNARTPEEKRQAAKDFLHQKTADDFTLRDDICQKKFGALVQKPRRAYKMYRKIVKYFCARTLIEFCDEKGNETLSEHLIGEIRTIPLYTEWENIGGQIVPCEKCAELVKKINSAEIKSWQEVHDFYDECQSQYGKYKAAYALYLLEQLYSAKIEAFSAEIYQDIIADVTYISNEMYESSISSREKDFTDYYRCMTYRNKEEMHAVLGSVNACDFLHTLKEDTEAFNSRLQTVLNGMIHAGTQQNNRQDKRR